MPTVPEKSRKANIVPVRMPGKLYDGVKQCAEEDGMNISEWIRAVLRRAVQLRKGRH